MNFEKILSEYSEKTYLSENQIRNILESENLRLKTVEYFRNNLNRKFTTDFLKFLISKRKEKHFEIANCDNLMYASYLVGLNKNIEDSILIWEAKNIDFDMYCGLDVQLIVFDGVEKTIEYFLQLNTEDSKKAMEYLIKCNIANDFEDIDEYFSPYELPWWI